MNVYFSACVNIYFKILKWHRQFPPNINVFLIHSYILFQFGNQIIETNKNKYKFCLPLSTPSVYKFLTVVLGCTANDPMRETQTVL